MMTAEQFHRNGYGHTLVYPIEAYAFAESYAAKQLAELRKESAIVKKYEQKLLRELGRVMTALRCTDEFDGPDEAVRTANELVQALEDADKIRAELGFADTTPLNVWLADLRAQLAEKEREMAVLRSSRAHLLALLKLPQNEAAARAEAAEQRLQEAQARAECDAADWSDTHTAAEIEIADLRERLRQREAELERAQKERNSAIQLLCDLPLDRFGDDMGEHDAAEFVDNAGAFFDVMFRAKQLLRGERSTS